MKIFGWKSAGRGSLRPVNTHVPLARAYGGPALGVWPASYEAQVREGYLTNAIAQRAVRLVAEGVGSVKIKSADNSDGRMAAVALKLVTETSAGQGLMETVAAHVLLHGNAYIEIMRGGDGAPVELYALRPERVCVEADTRGWPVAFVYKAGQATTRMAVENIIHIRNMHPLDDHYGLGCLGAASGAVAIHNAAAKWNKALLDNAARPSGALTYDTGDTGALSGEQFDRLRAELDASFAGAVNAGRPMLLEGGLKWQALSLSPADMDFIALKESAAREIALAFGVPPMLLGLPGDATYANYREANKALWRQAILPLSEKILAALAQGLSDAFPGLTLDIDLEQITALAEDRERLWAQLSAADFLTMDERREAAGFEALKVEVPPPTVPAETITGVVELKYNPWHDNEDGKFTFSNHGNYAGGGSGFGGGGATGSWSKPKPKSSNASFGGHGATGSWDKPKTKKPSTGKLGGHRATGSWDTPKFRGGGGSFGGGGASGSWDNPKFRRNGGSFGGGGASGSWDKPVPKTPVPLSKRETVKAPKPSVSGVGSSVKPKSPNRKISTGGYHFETDSNNRSGRIHGELRVKPEQPRSRRVQREAGKPDRLASDHGGHFIAREFGGPEIPQNHFAQDAKINRGEYRKLELHWKGELKRSRKVSVDIVPSYKGSSRRPHSISVKYFVDGKFYRKIIPNPEGEN
jgi:HK97 family phage portal protein